MKFFFALSLLFAAILAVYATDNGLTTVVSWDRDSVIINGKRVFIYSGEFHYQRLPNPEMWMDVLQKYKANGLNAVSIYYFMSYHSPSRGVFDFKTPAKDIRLLHKMAQEVGLYVIARPGPYCNAETNGGGYGLWMSDGSGGKLRTSDETYHQAWLPFQQEVSSLIAQDQITNGGPVIIFQIENELQETTYSPTNTLVIYMEQIENATRSSGVVVPFSHNEKGQRSISWSTDYNDVGGAVNLYGLDSYPGGFSCTNINSGFNLVRNYYQWFQNYSYTQPSFFPEFEGGYFTPWGSAQFYDDCLAEHDPAFADVYYKNNFGQKASLFNIYMAFGGTNWGHSAAPVVYTSYDYSAHLRETREVTLKFKQNKLLGLFLRVSQDMFETNMESNGTGNAVSSTAIWTWVLRNRNSDTGFYLAQHSTSNSRNVDTFSVYLNTSEGNITIPNVQLNGRQSKFILSDYHFGNHTLLYTSAEVLTWGTFGDKTVIAFYLQQGQVGEFAFKNDPLRGLPSYQIFGSATTFAANGSHTGNHTRYIYTQGAGSSVVDFGNGVVAYLLEQKTAWNFFAPPTTVDPNVAPNEQVFVLGPYNVRTASVGSTVDVAGDNTNTTTIEVYASGAQSITWNGQQLQTTRTPYGSLTATIQGITDRAVTLPSLTGWKVADSLPEVSPSYDDSRWVVCNKTTTLSPQKPASLPVLFSSDYGFYSGIKLYRGYFLSNTATGTNITVQGGLAAGWSAWLNGVWVGGHPGNASATSTTAVLSFANATLSTNGSNVLTVVTDYSGHDETSTASGVENPRGIIGATLLGPSSSNSSNSTGFTTWKIQGQAGGDQAYLDPVRGPMNEGGLYGERLGWHLPGFDTSAWASASPVTDGLTKAGVKWYTTSFELDIDDDLDVPIGVQLGAAAGTVARVQLFVNGYQYGKFWPHIGPQTRFPVPPGVINNKGSNTLSLSVWAQTDAGAKLNETTLFAYGKYQTSFDFNQDWSALQPAWTSERLQYA